MRAYAEKYQGYTNYETWAVALWIDNDQNTQEEVKELVKTTLDGVEIDNSPSTDGLGIADFKHRRTTAVADALKDFVEELKENNIDLREQIAWELFSDLLNSAIDNVNWFELARKYIDEQKEAI